MEAQTVLLGALVSGFIMVIAWQLVSTIQHGKRLTALETSWSGFTASIKEDIEVIKEDIQKLNNRFDIFIKNELDVLKDIAKKGSDK